MDFLPSGPLAASVFFAIAWGEAVIIFFLVSKLGKEKDILTKLEEIKNVVDENSELKEKIDAISSKLSKHDHRFFLQTKEILKRIGPFFNRRTEDKEENFLKTRKIQNYCVSDKTEQCAIIEDIDETVDEEGYKEL